MPEPISEPEVKQPQQELLTVKLRTVLVNIHSANATAVSATIDAAVAVLVEAERQLNLPVRFEIKARPFKPGSFEIPLEIQEIAAAGMLYFAGGAPYLESLLNVFKNFFALKKLLKGNSPPDSAKDGAFKLDGNTINVSQSVVNVYVNSDVNRAVSKAAEEVQKDENISAIEFLKGEELKRLEVVERLEMPYLQGPDNTIDVEPESKDKRIKKAMLVIVKPVLYDSNDKWSLLFRDQPIWATIEDEAFRKDVVSRKELFATGDRLVTDLTIHQEWNPALKVFVSKSHTITKVHSHERPKEQKEFSFDSKKKLNKKASDAPKKSAKRKAPRNKGEKKKRGK
jgi:hypothetical protein